MELTVAHRSETGPVRANNEDFLGFWAPVNEQEKRERGALALIADGVGGCKEGEKASRMAVETSLEIFRSLKPGLSLNAALWQVFSRANLAVYDANTARHGGEAGMQTTLTAVLFRNDQIGVAHVGDCRTYLIHQTEVRCLTTDHTFVSFHQRMELFSEPGGGSPLRGGLTRVVGRDPIVTIDFAYANVDAGDLIVQVCDGVHAYISEGEIAEIVTHAPPDEACEKLLRLCEKRGTDDNMSVQICRVDRIQRVDYHRGTPVYRQPIEDARMGHELAVGDVLDDRFEVNKVISRSGMASIFQARDRESGAEVALKVPFMQFESDPAFYSRFQREEEIGRLMDHPSILKIIPVDPDKRSRPYIAMELLSGRTLDQVMQEQRPMSVSRAMRIAVSVCDALAYMHEHDIVHRDLKPQNIMVCDDGTLRIMDFGIAKSAAMRRVTFTGFSPAMGTPDYMAPEQVKGRRGDHRTDIYSLGAILYEMVTGHTPFEGSNPYLIMQARITGDPEAPTNFNGDITAQLEEIILHAMEREPRNRYNSAAEMKEELLHSDRVILTGRVERLRKPTVSRMRWRALLYWAGLALIPIVGFAILYLASRGHR